ncbi:MAG: sensor histidine kinase [Myxococcota bacterium]
MEDTPSVQDELLRDQLAMCAEMLQSLSLRWRNRAQAGRLGTHSLVEVAALIDALERGVAALAGREAPPSTAHTITAEAEQHFRLLVDGVKDYAIYMLDREGRITTWNAGAERIKGWPAEEVLGRSFSMFYTAEDRTSAKHDIELRRAAEEGVYREEGWRVRRDGSRFWASVVLTALRGPDGSLVGFAKVTQDVTNRRRAEEALRRSEERFRLLVDGVRDYALYMLDSTGRVTSWNTGARRLTGYATDEILGRHVSTFYTPEDQADGKAELELRVAREEGRYEEEGLRVRKDGTRYWANVVLTAVRDARGDVVGFAKITRDVTERRDKDQALLRSHEQLEDRVRERTAELERAYAEMESFSYTVSHDLRSPLRTIDGLAAMLEESADGQLPEEQRRLIDRIRRSVTRMAALVDHLLELSRVMRTPVVRASIDLAAMARDVIEDLRGTDPTRSVAFVCPERLPACADAQLTRAVLDNLLANAWKFTGRVTAPRIELGVSARNGERAWFVRDNGVGFEPRLAPRLFLPFERFHADEGFEGTGVGLATVARIARRHGGEAWAEGEVGIGATFWFTLGADAASVD